METAVAQRRGYCSVRSMFNKFEHIWGRGALYSDVKCILGNGHVGLTL